MPPKGIGVSLQSDDQRKFAGNEAERANFHCRVGADRTETITFILGAFLGMKYEDLIYDYEFTSLSVQGIRTRNCTGFRNFMKIFMQMPGNCLSDKATAFLKKRAGVTDRQLASIFNILLENKENAVC